MVRNALGAGSFQHAIGYVNDLIGGRAFLDVDDAVDFVYRTILAVDREAHFAISCAVDRREHIQPRHVLLPVSGVLPDIIVVGRQILLRDLLHVIRRTGSRREVRGIAAERGLIIAVGERAAVEIAVTHLRGQVEVRIVLDIERVGRVVAAVHNGKGRALSGDGRGNGHGIMRAVQLVPAVGPRQRGRAAGAAELDAAGIVIRHVLVVRDAGQGLVLSIGIAGVEQGLHVLAAVSGEGCLVALRSIGLCGLDVQQVVRQPEADRDDRAGGHILAARVVPVLRHIELRVHGRQLAEVGDGAVAVFTGFEALGAI